MQIKKCAACYYSKTKQKFCYLNVNGNNILKTVIWFVYFINYFISASFQGNISHLYLINLMY